MKILQSTTDFVLANSDENSKEYQHAKTLKLKPELWMFVPTDENGNVLEEPYNYKIYDPGYSGTEKDIDFIECQKYQTALSKVWFNGWFLHLINEEFIRIGNRKCFLTNYKDSDNWFLNAPHDNSIQIQTIEQLIPHNLEITENYGK